MAERMGSSKQMRTIELVKRVIHRLRPDSAIQFATLANTGSSDHLRQKRIGGADSQRNVDLFDDTTRSKKVSAGRVSSSIDRDIRSISNSL